MTATNHALTGALIGLLVANPIVAIPLAVASHFVCDAIPHFGSSSANALKSRSFARMLFIDAILCILLVAVLFTNQSANWLLASICAFAATSPDLMWIPKFLRARANKKPRMNRHIFAFHQNIQWFQRPIGAVVEVVWAIGLLMLIAPFVK